jgi:hypothetical protein
VSVRIPQNAGVLEWLAAQTKDPPRRMRAKRGIPDHDLRCHPDLVERLESSAANLPGVRLRYLVGFPVLQHPNEIVFGIAAGTTWLAFRLPQLGQRAVVPSRWGTRGLDAEWVDVDPWLSDLPLQEGTNRVRGWSRAAYAHAAELGGATLGGPRPRPMRRRRPGSP